MNDLFCRYADTPSRQYDSPPTPTRPYADSIPHTPIRRYNSPPADTVLLPPIRPNAPTPLRPYSSTSIRRYDSPSADTFRSSVGIVRVFYGTLPLHKGVIADYNL
jgi:hypothetical protein